MPEYFERGAAIELLHYNADETCSAVVRDFEAIPAADVAPVVHSYWEHKITSYGEIVSICHNCKYPVSWFWELAKFCPNCGARMDGDSNALD